MSQTPAPRRLYLAEPRALWQQRPPVVADCSALAALVFEEPAGDEAAAMLINRALHAPTLLPYELANVANKKQRAGGAPDWLEAALQDYADQCIDLHPVPPAAAARLAARYALSAYDAAYLWLAAELKAPLATFDRKLADAAKRHLAAPD